MDRERLEIFNKYRIGRAGLRVDPWEDPNFQEEFARKDRFGFIHDTRITSDTLDDATKEELERLEKWMKILALGKREKVRKQWDLDFDTHRLAVRSERIRDLVYRGIPEAVRGEVWQKLLGTQRLAIQQRGVYEQMRQRAIRILEIQYVAQIDNDINRCFRNHESYKDRYSPKQCSLFNVLTAYAVYNTELGYCQGLHFVAALLLMYMDEEAAFWGLSQLLTHRKWLFHGYYTHGFPKLTRCMQFLDERVLRKLLPSVKKHLDHVGYAMPLCASAWFMQLYACRVPFSVAVHFWDVMLLEGEKAVIWFAYIIMRNCKKQLVRSSLEDVETLFKQELPKNLRLRRDQSLGDLLLNAKEQLEKLMVTYKHEDADWPKKPFGYLTREQLQRDNYFIRHPEALILPKPSHNGHAAAVPTEPASNKDVSHDDKCLDLAETQPVVPASSDANGTAGESTQPAQPIRHNSTEERLLALSACIAAELDQPTHQVIVSADIESEPLDDNLTESMVPDCQSLDQTQVSLLATPVPSSMHESDDSVGQAAHRDSLTEVESESESDDETDTERPVAKHHSDLLDELLLCAAVTEQSVHTPHPGPSETERQEPATEQFVHAPHADPSEIERQAPATEQFVHTSHADPSETEPQAPVTGQFVHTSHADPSETERQETATEQFVHTPHADPSEMERQESATEQFVHTPHADPSEMERLEPATPMPAASVWRYGEAIVNTHDHVTCGPEDITAIDAIFSLTSQINAIGAGSPAMFGPAVEARTRLVEPVFVDELHNIPPPMAVTDACAFDAKELRPPSPLDHHPTITSSVCVQSTEPASTQSDCDEEHEEPPASQGCLLPELNYLNTELSSATEPVQHDFNSVEQHPEVHNFDDDEEQEDDGEDTFPAPHECFTAVHENEHEAPDHDVRAAEPAYSEQGQELENRPLRHGDCESAESGNQHDELATQWAPQSTDNSPWLVPSAMPDPINDLYPASSNASTSLDHGDQPDPTDIVGDTDFGTNDVSI